MQTVDFLVIGSGLAGLTFAASAPDKLSVLVLTKRQRDETATALAQGGVAAAIGQSDSFDEHFRDTVDAGAGLCREEVVRSYVQSGPAAIQVLRDAGVNFTTAESGTESELALGLEGGHHRRRIVHAADATGAEVERAMLAWCARRPNVQVLEHHIAVDVITARGQGQDRADDRALGAYVLDEQTGEVKTFGSRRAVVLATGGSGKAYLYTSNPDTATGDGVALAFRARVPIANMEFVQFHPTCLFHPQAKAVLISEALRGEGGELKRLDGTPFMGSYHAQGSLAPRDIVARAIDAELKRSGDDCVVLDMTHLAPDFLEQHFPNIHATCLRYGIDMRRRPIPVVPAAHYQCGGVLVDVDGRSALPGLFALGECACTGLHGANRLASNSLLEAAVAAQRAATVAADLPGVDLGRIRPWDPGQAVEQDERVVVAQNWDELRRFMWNYVGIVRTDRRLYRAQRRIDLLDEEIREYYWRVQVDRDLLELRNIANVARLVVASALCRRESRGLHFNVDCPERDDVGFGAVDTVLVRGAGSEVVYQPFLGRHDRPVSWPGWSS
ncbi:MAG: L-aspartate oxidase [Deltaproteobacteria bacterium]|nr:L-aspartate oxidase [Deltaproteobacteria bacterium]